MYEAQFSGDPTMLVVEAVDHRNLAQFVQYSAEHGPEHDDSYLPGPEFTTSAEQPSYLLLQDGAVVGAVSLIRTPGYLAAGRGRFAIFHSTIPFTEAYSMLFEAIRRHFDGLQSVYLFLPQDRHKTAAIVRDLGFHVVRYSYVLVLREPKARHIQFPEGIAVVPLRSTDEALIRQFAAAVNTNFSALAGHVHQSPEDVQRWFAEDTYIEEGICLLVREDQPIGTLCVMREFGDRNAAEIIALSIAREFRGKGLGRMLLRYAVRFAVSNRLQPVILSVNAENGSALGLYTSEGFVLVETVVCYARDCA
jgi:mycothiol synthase